MPRYKIIKPLEINGNFQDSLCIHTINKVCSSSSSQNPLIGEISPLTFVYTAAPLSDMRLPVGLEGIQGSSQIFIFSPLSTLHMYPLLKVDKPAIILCHVKEQPAFGSAIRMFHCG
jgi:hypothetical protein